MFLLAYLWMEENFWSQKPFVADINVKVLFCHRVFAHVLLDVLGRVGVKLVELFGDVWTHITVTLLKEITTFEAFDIVSNSNLFRTLIAFAVSRDCSGGIPTSLSRRSV